MTTLDPEGLERAAEALFEREFSFDWHAENLKDTMSVESQFVREAQAAVEAYLGHATVTTVAELDALPNHSVVLDDLGDAWQKIAGQWESVGEDIMSGDAFFRFHNLKARPARIIYQPTP